MSRLALCYNEPRADIKRIPLLAKPLANRQIEAASKFWKENGSWETKEFKQLKKVYPRPQDAVTLKAVAPNALYGTNVIAISKVAESLESLMSNASHSTAPDLVEEWVAGIKKVTNREHYVFCRKICPFLCRSRSPHPGQVRRIHGCRAPRPSTIPEPEAVS